MLKEFKEFAMRGNVLDMAVGIVIGAAFGGIVTSFVNDVLMPPIGLLLGRVDSPTSSSPSPTATSILVAQAKAAGAATLNVGIFMNTVINFIIGWACRPSAVWPQLAGAVGADRQASSRPDGSRVPVVPAQVFVKARLLPGGDSPEQVLASLQSILTPGKNSTVAALHERHHFTATNTEYWIVYRAQSDYFHQRNGRQNSLSRPSRHNCVRSAGTGRRHRAHH